MVQKIVEFIMGPGGVLLFAALFAVSEFLTVFPKVAANGVFQAIRNGVKWVFEKLKAKQPAV